VVLHGDPGLQEERLGRILSFFGVTWTYCQLSAFADRSAASPSSEPFAVLASAETIAAAMQDPGTASGLQHAAALFAYAPEDREVCQEALNVICGGGQWRATPAPEEPVAVAVTGKIPAFTGPMSAVGATVQLSGNDSVFVNRESRQSLDQVVISAGHGALFVRAEVLGTPLYLSASASVVDLDQPVARNYYDIKDHFAAAVPLIMFLVATFAPVMWRPLEQGACLIIDDPLLKSRYGFCDFRRLAGLMRQQRFTTSIAFIPWNWRRTTAAASAFFRDHADLFSVSIHGCDHVAAEFGSRDVEALDRKASLAQARMRAHQQRTGLQHEAGMVFPQGVFSRETPAVLKQNGFVAAINTEVSPAGNSEQRTRLRDLWDVAIMEFGSFPIYTRRYTSHGIENFAFDLLLGKPCFIVAHHEFFKDGGAALVEFIEKLRTLNCTLHWRSPLEVIRRAYRRRSHLGLEQVEMFGNEVLLNNPTDRAFGVSLMKRERDASTVASVEYAGRPLEWTSDGDHLRFSSPQVPPGTSALVKISYNASDTRRPVRRSLKYETAVMVRRVLSQFRDEYVQRLRQDRPPAREVGAPHV